MVAELKAIPIIRPINNLTYLYFLVYKEGQFLARDWPSYFNVLLWFLHSIDFAVVAK